VELGDDTVLNVERHQQREGLLDRGSHCPFTVLDYVADGMFHHVLFVCSVRVLFLCIYFQENYKNCYYSLLPYTRTAAQRYSVAE